MNYKIKSSTGSTVSIGSDNIPTTDIDLISLNELNGDNISGELWQAVKDGDCIVSLKGQELDSINGSLAIGRLITAIKDNRETKEIDLNSDLLEYRKNKQFNGVYRNDLVASDSSKLSFSSEKSVNDTMTISFFVKDSTVSQKLCSDDSGLNYILLFATDRIFIQFASGGNIFLPSGSLLQGENTITIRKVASVVYASSNGGDELLRTDNAFKLQHFGFDGTNYYNVNVNNFSIDGVNYDLNEQSGATFNGSDGSTGTRTTLASGGISSMIVPMVEDVTPVSINVTNPFQSRRKPTFDFQFDGTKGTHPLTLAIFDKYRIPVSFAFDNSESAIDKIPFYIEAAKRGHGLLYHGSVDFSDSGAITAQEVEDEIVKQKKFFLDNGIVITGYVPLGSAIHDDFMPIVEKHFGYAFTGKSFNDNHTSDPIELRRVGLESLINTSGVQGVKDVIETGITNVSKISFYGHELPSTYLNNGTPFMSVQDMEDICIFMREKIDLGLCLVENADNANHMYYKTPLY